ncbi:SpoIID/LytB domain-containing protein [Dysosmobacter sp.]|uniref:SpoIID/LytB domain-containing protein n=1 Tax=Dysosmobacter sp. TaxID=2591382 RepID=UPI002A8A85AE|nr:SpoIID/LytB domain-containing protein [Dysosmobacter sp.]MDY3281930.1 SpoIID/LytB domain-containing protein [Dysosmobacter sp.]
MKKFLVTLLFVVTFFSLTAAGASAAERDTIRVGLRYGSSALFSANLENAVGSGYAFGWYDSHREFCYLGETAETKISMTAAGDISVSGSGTYSEGADGGKVIGRWHVQLDDVFDSFDEAEEAAWEYDGGYPAYIADEFVVRVGSFADEDEAWELLEELGADGDVVSAGRTGVMVTVTGTTQVLFEFDCLGADSLAVLPDGQGEDAVTWFKGYKYPGGFEYNRVTGGDLHVVNVVDLEDYVKGVLPYEMGGGWPEAALQAQAVCARTYACRNSKHLSSYGFDVCNTTDCQVYNGRSGATDTTDAAVDATAGECIYDRDGQLIEALYFSSDGGATEDSANVFGGETSYLVGKQDPYEELIDIPNYRYTVTYTPAQLTWVLQNSGYSIGNIQNVYVSEYTKVGNVLKVTFVDDSGGTLTLKGDKARYAFYSTTYNKSVPSMRFTINGGETDGWYVNDGSHPLEELDGVSVISGSGQITGYSGSGAYVITAGGVEQRGGSSSSGSGDGFIITGTGNGHNVGMSQYGANAMAREGYDYEEILTFYYTDVTVW